MANDTKIENLTDAIIAMLAREPLFVAATMEQQLVALNLVRLRISCSAAGQMPITNATETTQ